MEKIAIISGSSSVLVEQELLEIEFQINRLEMN